MLTSERASRAAFQTGEGRGLTAWGGSGAEGSGKEKGIGRSAGGAGGVGDRREGQETGDLENGEECRQVLRRG